ncbi:uncharacterized protein LOC103987476 [Musa acuminata AAA Group]|uniref:uncharacterized protein LOC103987476 n=1 Tax=Musa acuminata AAA Group TaxID=214697 RepID=UPI0031E3986E
MDAAAKKTFVTACSSSLVLLLLLLLLISPRQTFPSPVQGAGYGGGEGGQQQQQGPQPAERAIGLTGFANLWDAVRTWANLAWMNLRPPDSMKNNGRSESSAGEVVKEAASRSFETSKEAVGQAAESAAKTAEDAVRKSKEKVKRTASVAGGEPDAEL